MKTNEKLVLGTINSQKENEELSNNIFNLTGKEISVLSSLAKGNSYKMIAGDCDITVNTVREHIRNIYRKLKVHSMTEAVIVAMKHKLFQLPVLIYLIA